MKSNIITSFKNWRKVVDYESDETTVSLFGKNRKLLAEYNYPKFTEEDYIRLSSI